MKLLILILLSFTSMLLNAADSYRIYLLSTISYHSKYPAALNPKAIESNSTCFIPRYEIPIGNVFCRMEDKLTRATKVWIKVGVK